MSLTIIEHVHIIYSIYRAGRVSVHRTCCEQATQTYSLGGGGTICSGSRAAVTTRSPRIVTECLFTRSMLIQMYVYIIYCWFRIGTILSTSYGKCPWQGFKMLQFGEKNIISAPYCFKDMLNRSALAGWYINLYDKLITQVCFSWNVLVSLSSTSTPIPLRILSFPVSTKLQTDNYVAGDYLLFIITAHIDI